MGSTYEEKRAELKATAEGGIAGRQAYKEGRERLVSDQRSAIDAALAGPVRFGTGTADALRAIIQPSGDAALARIDHAGDRFGASMGELDTYLNTALSQQGGARKLNYSTRLADAKLDTDRNIEMGQIQRRKQAEDLWRRTEEANRLRAEAEAERGGASDYSQSEQKAAAEALGGEAHAKDLETVRQQTKKQTVDALLKVAARAFGDLDPILQGGLLDQVWKNADNPDAIAQLVREYSPAYAEEADGVLTAGNRAMTNVGRSLFGGAPVQRPMVDPGRATALDRMIEGYGSEVLPGAQQAERAKEVERYLYNQDAYTALFGDPLLAAGIFPQSFDPVEETNEFGSSVNDYISTGMTGKELTQAREAENEQMLANLASGAGLSEKVINSTLDDLPVDATEVYAMLGDEDTAGVVADAVSGGVAAARESVGTSTKAKQDAAANFAAAAVQEALSGADPQYVQALAMIAAEQARIYAKVG